MGYIPKIPSTYNCSFLQKVEEDILTYSNSARNKLSIPSLIWDEELRDIARYKSNEMMQYGYFAHNSPYTGRSYSLARDFFNYHYLHFGENIQMAIDCDITEVTAKFLVDSWIKSPSHRDNILKRDYSKMATGVVYCEEKKCFYSSQMFSD